MYIENSTILILIILGEGGKLSLATQNLVKSARVLNIMTMLQKKQISLFDTVFRHDEYLKFQFKKKEKIIFDQRNSSTNPPPPNKIEDYLTPI